MKCTQPMCQRLWYIHTSWNASIINTHIGWVFFCIYLFLFQFFLLFCIWFSLSLSSFSFWIIRWCSFSLHLIHILWSGNVCTSRFHSILLRYKYKCIPFAFKKKRLKPIKSVKCISHIFLIHLLFIVYIVEWMPHLL